VQLAPQPRSTVTRQPNGPLLPRSRTNVRGARRNGQRSTVLNTPAWKPRRNTNTTNRNWALGGDKRRPTRPARTLAELVELRELARTKYEHGGGYDRDLRDYNDLQREIVRLQDRQMQLLRESSADSQTLRQAERNYRATRGLNARRYRGTRDTSWPVGERRVSRWLGDPSYRE
jgi:hypothetical protein